jgi:hypothetical protein
LKESGIYSKMSSSIASLPSNGVGYGQYSFHIKDGTATATAAVVAAAAADAVVYSSFGVDCNSSAPSVRSSSSGGCNSSYPEMSVCDTTTAGSPLLVMGISQALYL